MNAASCGGPVRGEAQRRVLSRPSTEEVKAIRELWEGLTNEHLKERGTNARIDHRSLEAQGVDRGRDDDYGLKWNQQTRKDAMKITEDTLRTLEREYSKWAFVLNNFLGVISFTLGISCLGTPRPDITGGLSLVFMLVVGIYSRKEFPKTLIHLRDAQLSELDRLTRDGLRKKYLSLGAAVTHAPVYLIGWLFLGAVTAWGGLHHP